MRKILPLGAVLLALFAISPALAQEEKKAKPLKVTGDIGLLDLEKNYMIVVTKEGKLVTIDFNNKTKVTRYVPEKAKIGDIGLGTSVGITYKDKIVDLEAFEFKVKAKKGE